MADCLANRPTFLFFVDGALQDTDTDAEAQQTRLELARVMLDTARIRSGFALGDSSAFAARIERMLRLSLDVDVAEAVEAEPETPAEETEETEEAEEADDDAEDAEPAKARADDEL